MQAIVLLVENSKACTVTVVHTKTLIKQKCLNRPICSEVAMQTILIILTHDLDLQFIKYNHQTLKSFQDNIKLSFL